MKENVLSNKKIDQVVYFEQIGVLKKLGGLFKILIKHNLLFFKILYCSHQFKKKYGSITSSDKNTYQNRDSL